MGWMKIFGVGQNSCELISKLSPLVERVRGYDGSELIERKDLICIKGVRGLEELSHYVKNGEYCWFVLDKGLAFQEVFRVAWREIKEKIDFCLVFHLFGAPDEKFYYELLAYDSVNHLIELADGNASDTKKKAYEVLKGLFHLMLVPSIICMDVALIKYAFSRSFLIKATSLKFKFGEFKSTIDKWLSMLDSQPKFLLLAVFASNSATIDEIYEFMGYLVSGVSSMGENFEKKKDFFWSFFIEDELLPNHYQITLFWA